MQLCCSKGALLYIPCERDAKVFMLGIEPLEPFALGWTGEFFFGSLAKIQEEMQEPRLEGVHLARLTETVEGVLANCFQHAVARGPFSLFKNEQRFIDQPGHRIQHID